VTSLVHLFDGFMVASRSIDVPDYNSGFVGETTSIERLPTEPIGTTALTLLGLVAGSDIVILDAGTETERTNVDAHAGTSYSYTYGYFAGGGGTVDIGVFKTGYVPFYARSYSLGSAAAVLPIAQVPDRNFSNP
jgi:hypothetical protein